MSQTQCDIFHCRISKAYGQTIRPCRSFVLWLNERHSMHTRFLTQRRWWTTRIQLIDSAQFWRSSLYRAYCSSSCTVLRLHFRRLFMYSFNYLFIVNQEWLHLGSIFLNRSCLLLVNGWTIQSSHSDDSLPNRKALLYGTTHYCLSSVLIPF